jgi:hypothetical protein
MSLGIAACLCAVIWTASLFGELPEPVRFVRGVVLAFCAGYLLAILAGIGRGFFDHDPQAIYRLGPVFGGAFALLATGFYAWRIRARRNLTRVRLTGDGAYRDPAAVPESPEPPRATVLPPRGARAMGRFLIAVFFLCWPAAIAVLELESTRVCERYPRACSNRSIARAIAHSREEFGPSKLPDAACRNPEDVPYCGRSDPSTYATTRVLAARGASAVSDIAEVVRDLPDDQFVHDCAALPYCVNRVKSLMDLLERQRNGGVDDALRRWLHTGSAPRELRAEAAAQLARSGHLEVLPELAESLCTDYGFADRSMVGILAEHLKPETVRHLEPVLSKPGVSPCVLQLSVRALLPVNSPSAWSAIERLQRRTDSYRSAMVYQELALYFQLAPRGTVELLTRLSIDGPDPQRACHTLARVQEKRLGRPADALFDFCGGTPTTAAWRAKMEELGQLSRHIAP